MDLLVTEADGAVTDSLTVPVVGLASVEVPPHAQSGRDRTIEAIHRDEMVDMRITLPLRIPIPIRKRPVQCPTRSIICIHCCFVCGTRRFLDTNGHRCAHVRSDYSVPRGIRRAHLSEATRRRR